MKKIFKLLKMIPIVLLITIVGILILKNINYANTIKTSVEVKYTAPILMKYGNIRIDTPVVKVNVNGKEYPAYCLDVKKIGAGEKMDKYDLEIKNQIDNNLVYSMIINGYPYKTLAELRSKNRSRSIYSNKTSGIYSNIWKKCIRIFSNRYRRRKEDIWSI